MPQLCKALPRFLLLPPVFFATAICLWMASTVFPNTNLHICVSRHRKQFQCFRSQSFGMNYLREDDVSTHISSLFVKQNSLKLDGIQETAGPNKPLQKVKQLDQREELYLAVDPPNESEVVVEEATQGDRDDFEVHFAKYDLGGDKLQQPLLHGVPQQELSKQTNDETQFHSTEGGANSRNRIGFSKREEEHVSKTSEGLSAAQSKDERELQDDHANGSTRLAAREDRNGYQSRTTTSVIPQKNGSMRQTDMAVSSAETGSKANLDSLSEAQRRIVNLIDQENKSGNHSSEWSIPLHNEMEEQLVHLMEIMRRSAAPQIDSRSGGADAMLRKSDDSYCGGRKVYIYDLPSKFNADLLAGCDTILPWFNICKYVVNSGMGERINDSTTNSRRETILVPAGRWYSTNQWALEMMFHARIQEHECRTLQPEEASAFYVPFYGGMDILRWNFRQNTTNDRKDKLSLELVKWLGEQKWWRRRGGNDHVFVLGKISWDFRRSGTGRWGSSLLQMTETQNVTKLMIERHPWEPNDIGVPHTTFFHPSHDEDIELWQRKIDGAQRTNLVSFAGMPRANRSGSIRSTLIQQCENNSDACFFLRCSGDVCQHPENPISLFMQSEFCLQPPGDSPTRRSIFDSLIAGCVPVLFNLYSAYFQYPWHLPADPATYSVFVPQEDVVREDNPVNVVNLLQRIPPAARAEMRRTIIYDIMPGLLYAAPGARLTQFNDAFDIALDRLLWRVANKLQKFAAFSEE